MIAMFTMKFARERIQMKFDILNRYDTIACRIGDPIGTKVKIVNGEDEESKSRDQSDMPRIRSTSIRTDILFTASTTRSVLLIVQTPAASRGFHTSVTVVG
ncbi:hypothetical protein Bca4012_074413 [Brassica carinata]